MWSIILHDPGNDYPNLDKTRKASVLGDFNIFNHPKLKPPSISTPSDHYWMLGVPHGVLRVSPGAPSRALQSSLRDDVPDALRLAQRICVANAKSLQRRDC